MSTAEWGWSSNNAFDIACEWLKEHPATWNLTECASGYYLSAGATACEPCQAGYFVEQTWTDKFIKRECDKCPSGTYT